MKIAILGGSFDPPHIGHALVAIQVKELLRMDKILLMPCYNHPFEKKLSSFLHRFTMTKSLENSFIKVSDHEAKRRGVSFTIDTLNSLSGLFPNDKFYWIISSQEIENLPKWKNWKEIIDKHNLIIFPRRHTVKQIQSKIKKYLKLKSIKNKIIILDPTDLIFMNISSTNIRQRVGKKQSVKHMVTDEVEKYISANNLYV